MLMLLVLVKYAKESCQNIIKKINKKIKFKSAFEKIEGTGVSFSFKSFFCEKKNCKTKTVFEF